MLKISKKQEKIDNGLRILKAVVLGKKATGIKKPMKQPTIVLKSKSPIKPMMPEKPMKPMKSPTQMSKETSMKKLIKSMKPLKR